MKKWGLTPLKDCGYTLWFDETYKETYLTLRRAGRILLAHLCPALLGDLDELLDSTYCDMSRKEWLLRNHPNITGWLIVAFRYVVYHRIRAWYRQQRVLERCANELRVERVADPVAEALNAAETEAFLRDALGASRYALLRAHRCEGVCVRELAKQTGKSVRAMEVSLWRWRKTCEKLLKGRGNFLLFLLSLYVNFGFFLGV